MASGDWWRFPSQTWYPQYPQYPQAAVQHFGWECPKCHAVYAPWWYQCSNCTGEVVTTVTTTANANSAREEK